MLKKMPIRWRLTALSVLLLCICCVGLTVLLNFSALRMASTIEAIQITPALTVPIDGAQPATPATALEAPTTALEPTAAATTSVAAKSRFLYQSLFGMIFVVLLGGGLTYIISGRALKPLQKLSEQMQCRTVENLSDKLPVPQSHDEIADLTQSFNDMSQKLEDAFAMQKRFSQSAAHELRTPLTVLKTKVEVFKKKNEHTNAEYDALLWVITTHTNRLSDLVKDLLALANMDALDCSETIALRPLLCEVCKELAPLAQNKNIAISVNGDKKSIEGNRSLLHRAFYNLVENAINYNRESGAVDIRIDTVESHGVIAICDTGIGISPEDKANIFEPFYRVDKSRSRQMGGAGLGLATVKAIVEKHHGTIVVHENPNGGSIFEVAI